MKIIILASLVVLAFSEDSDLDTKILVAIPQGKLSKEISSIKKSIIVELAKINTAIANSVEQEERHYKEVVAALEKNQVQVKEIPAAPRSTSVSMPTSIPEPTPSVHSESEILVLKHDFTKQSPFMINGWKEYKNGFGRQTDKNYWLGLDDIHRLTSTGNWNLKVQVKYDLLYGGSRDPRAGTIGEAEWESFSVAGESSKYRLTIGSRISRSNFPSDPFHAHTINGKAFATVDKDNNRGCATNDGGGWWYDYCAQICLTCSRFSPNRGGDGMLYWGGWKLPSEASMWLIKKN